MTLHVEPTVVIDCSTLIGEGGVRVYPQVFLEELADGEHDIKEHQVVLRAALRDWLNGNGLEGA